MFDLETSIATWRHYLARRRGFLQEDLDELERHLRDAAADAVRRGATDEEAFRQALAAVGDLEGAELEYRKVYWGKLQRRHGLAHELTVRRSMFTNYLKTTLRSLLRKKGYAFINLAGLTLGIVSCLVIFQYVAFEYSFDRFHAHEPELFRVLQTTPLVNEVVDGGSPYTGFALAPALTESVPEIAGAARVHPEYNPAVVARASRPDRVFEETRIFYADPAFLDLFSFPLAEGGEPALAPGTALISEAAAAKYFGTDDPIGEEIDVAGAITRSYRVTGVLRDVPRNSHIQFDFLLPMADLIREGYDDEPEDGWSWNNFYTYVRLLPDANLDAVEEKMTAVYQARRGEALREQGRTAQLYAQPLRDVHLNADVGTPDVFVTGSYRTVYFFSVIGLVTLLIALVNYVNLATARALDRAREVGVRKAIGAHRRQLIVQFLCESALTNAAAAVLALVLAVVLTPVVNDLTGTELTGALWLSPWFWAAFVVTFALCTAGAGLYPAFVLSSFQPVAVLKGRGGAVRSGLWLRRGLVVFQFAASVALISGTAVVYQQLGFMQRMDLGIDLEQVLTVQAPRVLPEGTDLATASATLVQELRAVPGVRDVARSSTVPGQGFNWNGASFRRPTDDPANTLRGVVTYIDENFAEVYGMQLVAGNGFADITTPVDDADAATDSADAEPSVWPVIANEASVRSLGYASPADAVGENVDIGGYDAQIVGVFEDVNWSSAHEPLQNIFFGQTEGGRFVSVRTNTSDVAGVIAAAETIYGRLFPGNVFRYAFMDEAYGEQYRNEERFATLFTLFAGLAIVIACLGLFGLASFTTQQRTKEIGVRKVLGASVPELVALLTRDVLRLVAVAVVLAAPLAYLVMRSWLNGFAYHVDLGPGVFALVGALALLIALLTVAYQSIRTALTDPASVLRVE